MIDRCGRTQWRVIDRSVELHSLGSLLLPTGWVHGAHPRFLGLHFGLFASLGVQVEE